MFQIRQSIENKMTADVSARLGKKLRLIYCFVTYIKLAARSETSLIESEIRNYIEKPNAGTYDQQ